MAKVNLLVCDSCDCRDNLEHPPKNDIQSMKITVETSAGPPPKVFCVDLCIGCRSLVERDIQRGISQTPGSANGQA